MGGQTRQEEFFIFFPATHDDRKKKKKKMSSRRSRTTGYEPLVNKVGAGDGNDEIVLPGSAEPMMGSPGRSKTLGAINDDIAVSLSKSEGKLQPSIVPKKPTGLLRLLVLIVLVVASGVGNNVTFWAMGNAMPAYPLFLLYATTILYSFVYWIWMLWRQCRLKEGKSMYTGSKAGLINQYLWVGVMVTVGGVLSQFADPYVRGSLQAVINQMTLPLTALLARFVLRQRFTKMEIAGAIIVLIGSAVPVIPPLFASQNASGGQDSIFWLVIFIISDLPSAIVNIQEEHIFIAYQADEVHYLFWTNLVTVGGYLACLPLDMVKGFGAGVPFKDLFHQQGLAFKCFLGITPLPPNCEPDAWIPVTAFVVAFAIYFYLLCIVIKRESAAFQAMVNSLVTPMSAVAFSFPWLMGKNTEPLTSLTIFAIVVIPLGILVYKYHDIKKINRTDEKLPLISRH